MRAAALLFAACVASFLAASGVYGGGANSGKESCGAKQRWRLDAGDAKMCCTDPSRGSVNRFEYYVEKDDGTGKETWEARDVGPEPNRGVGGKRETNPPIHQPNNNLPPPRHAPRIMKNKT